MLRLDSSEMLPGSQKGEETAQIPSTAIVVALATRGSLAMIAFTKGNETGRDSSSRASLPCARVKTAKHSKLHIRFSDAHLNTKTVDGYSGYIILPYFYKITLNINSEGQLAMDLIIGQQTSRYFLRKATYNLKFGVYSL